MYQNFLIIILIISACSTKIEKPIVSQIGEHQLSFHVLNYEEINRHPVSLAVVDTFLLLLRRNDPLFLVFGTQSHQLLGSFGKSGDGEGEFEAHAFFSYLSGDNSENPTIGIFDYKNQRLSFVNIRGILYKPEENSLLRQQRLTLGGMVTAFYAHDEKFSIAEVEEGFSSNPPYPNFKIHDHHNQLTYRMPPAPYASFDIRPKEPIVEQLISLSTPAYHPKKQILAVAHRFLPIIDFLDADFNSLQSLRYDDPLVNKRFLEGTFIEENGERRLSLFDGRGYLENMFYSEDYIFLLHLKEPFNSPDNAARTLPQLLRVVDWEGRERARFAFSLPRAISPAYDRLHHRIYFYCNSMDENNLFYADLPQF